MAMAVFVLDERNRPLMPFSEKRARLGIPKTHALDAACVGEVDAVQGWRQPVLEIRATGRGAYQRTRLNKHGFPRGRLTRRKRHYGLQTGDMVYAAVPTARNAGVYRGRVAVRASGSFNIQTPQGVVQGVSHRHCHLLQRGDVIRLCATGPTRT
jgi:hypothetical protein